MKDIQNMQALYGAFAGKKKKEGKKQTVSAIRQAFARLFARRKAKTIAQPPLEEGY